MGLGVYKGSVLNLKLPGKVHGTDSPVPGLTPKRTRLFYHFYRAISSVYYKITSYKFCGFYLCFS